MIAERTGSLAGIKRHDYLPFGEELYSGTGGRTLAQGYTGDDVRQKFTGYEMDSETGLNYAQARYQSPVQGRFTSVDPMLGSAGVTSPQSWNRYSYCLNNPVNSTDPTGMMTMITAEMGYGEVSGLFAGPGDLSNNVSHFGGPQDIADAEADFGQRLQNTLDAKAANEA